MQNFTWRAVGFQVFYIENCKGSSNRLLGIPSDVRSAQDNIILAEIYKEKKLNLIYAYWDDKITVCEDRYLKLQDCSTKEQLKYIE